MYVIPRSGMMTNKALAAFQFWWSVGSPWSRDLSLATTTEKIDMRMRVLAASKSNTGPTYIHSRLVCSKKGQPGCWTCTAVTSRDNNHMLYLTGVRCNLLSSPLHHLTLSTHSPKSHHNQWCTYDDHSIYRWRVQHTNPILEEGSDETSFLNLLQKM